MRVKSIAGGIDIQDLTEAQIFEAVREAWERVKGSWVQIATILNCSKSSRMYLFLTPISIDTMAYPFRGPAASTFLNFLEQLKTQDSMR